MPLPWSGSLIPGPRIGLKDTIADNGSSGAVIGETPRRLTDLDLCNVRTLVLRA
ncbi:hypothetical protein F4781DRAFT_419004 [Annulohypoxylon bovei var. microspora]|nr:hypothetical protein F4781DRAFT_419004 [Annulohypoxylon bovei var. microspora]